MAAPDLKAHLVTITRTTYERLIHELKAVPADKQNASPGGVARAPLHYVAECGGFNGLVAEILSAGRLQTPVTGDREALRRFLATFDTEEKALAFLAEKTEALLAALESLDVETLGDTTDAMFGRPMTRLALASLPALHMSYHDGQLNYAQSLYGDAGMHWPS